jgi:putative RecB family exonuclease
VRVCCFLAGDMPSVSGRGLFVFEDTPGMDGQLSEASPTLPGMGDKSATVTAEAPGDARRPSAGFAGARSASPGAEPPDPHAAAAPGAPEADGAGDGVAPERADRPSGPSLSPSRAGDFLTCPLLYRFRVIDRLPEPPSPAAVRGTLVHSVLERLFDAAAADRTPDAARALVEPEWSRLQEAEPELAGLFDDDAQRAAWLDEVMGMLDRYFTLEDPRRIEPAHRELCVEAELASGLRLRGYIDRLDIAPGGQMRIVDYKTGGAPPEEFEQRALFQMRFYALTLWRAQGQVPKLLQLMYLGNGEIVRYEPDEADLLATERKIEALWLAIERAMVNRDWRPRPGRICDWCAHQAICPAFGGTPPPVPDPPVRPDEIPDPRDGASPV